MTDKTQLPPHIIEALQTIGAWLDLESDTEETRIASRDMSNLSMFGINRAAARERREQGLTDLAVRLDETAEGHYDSLSDKVKW